MPPDGGRLSIGDIVSGAAMREDADAGEAAATRTAASALSRRCLKPEYRPGSWRQRCLNASLGFKLYATERDRLDLIGIVPRIHRVQIRMMKLSSFAQS